MVDLVGELHLVISLRNGAEVGREADGDVVRVHLGHAAVLRQVRQQGEQEGHHLMGITMRVSPGFNDNEWTVDTETKVLLMRLVFETRKHHLETQSMCLILEKHPRRKYNFRRTSKKEM